MVLTKILLAVSKIMCCPSDEIAAPKKLPAEIQVVGAHSSVVLVAPRVVHGVESRGNWVAETKPAGTTGVDAKPDVSQSGGGTGT